MRAAATTTDRGVSQTLEKVRLARVPIGLRLTARLDRLIEHEQHAAARIARRIERAGANQALQDATRDVLRIDALCDIPDRDEPPVRLARLDDRPHGVLADVLDGTQPEANLALDDREIALRRVDIGWQHLKTHRLALGHVERHFVFGVHHRRDQRRHVLGRIVGLEVGRAVRDQGVAGGVSLVEGVLRAALVLDPEILGDLAIDAVGLAANHERLLQLAHQLGVLLTDRLA